MFQQLTMRGGSASLLWGYRTAAVVKSFTIRRSDHNVWTLVATLERVDAFAARQTNPRLLFAAPRKGGFFMWPVVDLQLGPSSLTARLGPVEF